MSAIKELNELNSDIKKVIYEKLEAFATESDSELTSFQFNDLDISLGEYGDCEIGFTVSAEMRAPR